MSIVEVDNVEDERLEDNLPESSLSGYPTYIQKLLSPNTPLDFHITVGDPNKSIPEKIGVLKWMLITRSKVLSVMLFESKMKETGDFSITDLDPHTFKNFLVFVYGHDNTSTISFEEAVKMLNVAEKYDVQDLKDKLAKRIQLQVTVENIFIILQNPEACEQAKSLWQTVTEIIQYNTEGMFSNEEFVNISEEAMIHILQQDSLSVPEIELWRASLKWASHKAGQEKDGGEIIPAESLRKALLPLLKYVRLCTLNPQDLVSEVVSTNILLSEEIGLICKLHCGQAVTETLQCISSNIQGRGRTSLFSDKSIQKLRFKNFIARVQNQLSSLCILTKEPILQLCALVCVANDLKSAWHDISDCATLTYRCKCVIKITRIIDYKTNTLTKDSAEVTFNEKVKYGERFTIPLKVNHHAVTLIPNSKYKLQFEFDEQHPTYCCIYVGNEYFGTDCFEVIAGLSGDERAMYGSHLIQLLYKVVR